jgi:hypothetical protein
MPITQHRSRAKMALFVVSLFFKRSMKIYQGHRTVMVFHSVQMDIIVNVACSKTAQSGTCVASLPWIILKYALQVHTSQIQHKMCASCAH